MKPTVRRPALARSATLATVATAALLAASCASSSSRPDGDATGTRPDARVADPRVADTRPLHVYVANESSDVVSELIWDGATLTPLDEVRVGRMPAELDGPHGLRVSPAGDFWFVSLAHGTPNGSLWKYSADTNRPVGGVQLGMFPASMDVAPNGELAFIVNFNLHGDPVPSTVSIVHTPTMAEVARPVTCVMPHGSRLSASGTKHYSVCMHSEQLVEIDTRTLEVTKRFSVAPGHEGALALDDVGAATHSAHTAGGAAADVCSPTWATPGRGERADRFVYVPCNRRGEILEIDVARDHVTRRFATGRAPYNLDTTPDGRLLLATLKQEQAVAVIDLDSGRELARVPTTQRNTHGLALSPDGRWAFVSNEATGATRSTVDVIDLASLRVVASAEVQQQAGGIDVAFE